MKIKICTDIEQSKHLLELGLDPDTADMSYYINYNNHVCYSLAKNNDRPAWSLTALLELMPMMELRKFGGKYTVYEKDYGSTAFLYENAIDAAYEYVCYLLRQGLIKNDKV